MLDFLLVSTRLDKRGVVEIYPKFIIKKSTDLMIRGGDFYAIWIEEQKLWSTDEQDALQLIDRELDNYKEEHLQEFESGCKVLHLWDAETGMIDRWHKYCQKQRRDSFHMLDEKLIFSNMETRKEDYASKKLNYPLEPGKTDAYDRLMSVLYSDEERHKIEWAIGSIVSGESKKLQKFLVLYGAAGTGKSTVLNIIQQLFEGYYAVFRSKDLGSANNTFALEAFKTNPLVAIEHDGDLSKIEDNTRLNSLVSHELMTVNEKFRSAYSNRFKSFLFLGTNKPVRITDAKSGLIRRLIDVSPTGNKVSASEYRTLTKQIDFELGAIAYHCQEVYLANPRAYDDYIPIAMLGASNDFYNFVMDSYLVFKREGNTTLKAAWEMYKTYCDEAKVSYPYSQRLFKEELKNYFRDYAERATLSDGTRVRNYYTKFRSDRFEPEETKPEEKQETSWLSFDHTESIFDAECADCPAQYATEEGKPMQKWVNVRTKLSDLDTSRTHYVKAPATHIFADFDIPGENGEKSFERNLEAASKWPPTYAELSKSGAGIHLHYIYTGDVSKLRRIYDDHIEIKTCVGDSALRRKLTKCNDLPIATINSGLPLKGEKVVNFDTVKSERSLRSLIKRNLCKEIHPGTKPSIDFIHHILEEAYASGLKYDVSDMRPAIIAFAANSTHQADYCIKMVGKMKFKSEEPSEAVEAPKLRIVFYDVEVFPNLFLVNWKLQGKDKPVIRMINPSPAEIEELMQFDLIGFNCRRYDNHILYACLMGYNNEQLYRLSQRIINDGTGFFGEAYNISYTDVYDFSSKKQSLKKFEIELGIHHQELGLPWDQPVPKEMWQKVAEYCDNDVLATEAVFDARKADFTARQILADVAGMTVNDTTNSLTTRIIFGSNRHPQDQFNYRDMGEVPDYSNAFFNYTPGGTIGVLDYTLFDKNHRPVFPGYKYEGGKSIYREEEVGEGGYVYAEPGMYGNVALLDIASMHPSSIVAEDLFGEKYTARFKEILDARIAIKHKDFEKAKEMLDGKLAKYLTDENSAADLAQALKIAINSVYGLTAAGFDNPFRDPRNKDNIVAKRGALFMVNLKHEVQQRGFTVAHIKTDSIKIPDATPEIIQFVMDYGKQYGYNFEHEATYDRMCLVNDAVYIAKYKDGKHAGEWTATGAQFQVPYVFKTLFSKEPIVFADMCETKSVSTAIYIDRSPDEALLYYQNENPGVGEEADDILLDNGHRLHFVGKVGLFTPMKPGAGGGTLVRQSKTKDGSVKYDSITGTKDYIWMESEMVKELGKEDLIDKSYYQSLVDKAIASMIAYGNYEWFVSDDPYVGPSFEEGEFMNKPVYAEELPFQ